METAKSANVQLRESLELLAELINMDPRLQSELEGTTGWMSFSIGMMSENGRVEQAIIVNEGRIRIDHTIPQDVDAVDVFADERAVLEYLGARGENPTIINPSPRPSFRARVTSADNTQRGL